MHSLIMFVYVTFLNFIWNEELLGWRPELSIGCRIGPGCATAGRALAQIPKPTFMGGLSSGPPELHKSVAAGNEKSHPWDRWSKWLSMPRSYLDKITFLRFHLYSTQKKITSEDKHEQAGVSVQPFFFFLTHKCFFKWKHKGDSNV